MVYKIEFTKNAEEELLKLPYEFQKRILGVLERIKFNPFYYAKKLIGTKSYRFRVGNYRLIADIEQNKLLILIIEIGARKNIYK